MKPKKQKAFFEQNAKYIVLLGVVFGSFSGNFARAIYAPPIAIGFFRLLFSLPVISLPILLKSEKRKELKSVLHDWKILGLVSVAALGLYGHYISLFKAVKLTSMASAATLASLHPLVVLFISYVFFKRRVGIKAVLGIVAALIGIGIIAGSDYSFDAAGISGDIFAFMSGVSLALYFVFGKLVREKNLSADVYMVLCFGICAILFCVTMLATGTKFFIYRPNDYMYMFGMALFCQIFAHSIINWSFEYVSDIYVSAWQTLEGVVAIVIAFFMFGEIPEISQVIGAVIAFGGLVYFNLNSSADWGTPNIGNFGLEQTATVVSCDEEHRAFSNNSQDN